jgi:RNA polymerase sigma-70 factor (ECF subfamily)
MSAGAPIRRERSDDELVRDFRVHGDQEYFRLLFDRHKRRVFAACRVFLQGANSAEDATQETFLRAFQNLDRFRNVDRFSAGNFGAWLMRIAKNVCIDTWRRQRRHAETAEESLAEISDGSASRRPNHRSNNAPGQVYGIHAQLTFLLVKSQRKFWW